MTKIAAVLRTEIARVAKKELRQDVDALRKAVTMHRSEIAALKRVVQEQQRALRALQKGNGPSTSPPSREPAKQLRFSAKRLAAQRSKLGLSAADFGALVGATAQTVYNWEGGKARPSAERLAAIAGLRGLGKRSAQAGLAVTCAEGAPLGAAGRNAY